MIAASVTDEHTHRVLGAQMAVGEMVSRHHLRVTAVAVAAGTRQRFPNGATAIIGQPVITIYTTPAGFLRWCEVLDATQVLLHRTESDLAAAAPDLTHGAHRWTIRAAITRAESLDPADDLPGTRLPWQHDRVRVGRERLATALTARGLA